MQCDSARPGTMGGRVAHLRSRGDVVGGEGGSIKLYGVRTNDGWLYQKDMVDQTPLMLDDKEIRHSSAFTSSWKEALELLDRNRWQRLSPIRVHPEFRQAIWAAVQQRYTGDDPEEDLERWRDRCGI